MRNGIRLLFFLIVLLNFFFATSTSVAAETTPQKVVILDVADAITPATAEYIVRGISKAKDLSAKLIVILLDTPGGLDKSMRIIIQKIISSPIPVATYVAPSGARAASAGTFILYASHIAAMAPGTNLGAASPVTIGGSMGEEEKKAKDKIYSPMEKKLKSDASAYIRSLAQMRGRNVNWAEKAVLEAESISASEALRLGVIDMIADNIDDLLNKLNGRSMTILNQNQILRFDNTELVKVAPDWRIRFLAVITDPNVAYILLLIGVYGLFFEFMNPGFVLPGVAGLIALLVALYAFQLLPINYVGLALILIGISFIVAEAFVPSYGALGVGGVIAFIVGSVMLFDTQVPGFQIMLPLIISLALVSVLFLILVVQLALRAHRKPVVSGREEIIDSEAEIIYIGGDRKHPRIRLRGELWQVKSDHPLHEGQKVKVIGIDELTLVVTPTTTESEDKNK